MKWLQQTYTTWLQQMYTKCFDRRLAGGCAGWQVLRPPATFLAQFPEIWSRTGKTHT